MLNEVAEAPDVVLLHYGRGHDRTGIMSVLLLAIAGATVSGVTEDYLASSYNLRTVEPGAADELDAALRDAGTTANAAIAEAMNVLDAD